MKRIATHQRPDVDALVAAWLVRRYLFAGARPRLSFIARESRSSALDAFDCVVDVGCAYCPRRLRFDHKPPAVTDRHSTCAARMVWEHLLAEGRPVAHIAALIDAVHDGDSVRRRSSSEAYRQSKRSGVHACFGRCQSRGATDQQTWRRVGRWLDRHWTQPAEDAAPAGTPSQVTGYGRGKVYLQWLEAACPEQRPAVNPRQHPPPLPALGQWDKRWTIADALAERRQTPRKQVCAGAKLAFAIDTLAEQCGEVVRQDILSGVLQITDRDLGTISRTAGPRQQLAIERVRQGKAPMGGKATVFDTVSFAEVTSRLARAWGHVRRCAWFAPAIVETGVPDEQIEIRIRRIEHACRELNDALDEGPPALPAEAGEPAEPKAPKPLKANGVSAPLGAALGLIEKNVRDLPGLPPRLRPLPHDSAEARRYVQQILCACRDLRRQLQASGHRSRQREDSNHGNL